MRQWKIDAVRAELEPEDHALLHGLMRRVGCASPSAWEANHRLVTMAAAIAFTNLKLAHPDTPAHELERGLLDLDEDDDSASRPRTLSKLIQQWQRGP